MAKTKDFTQVIREKLSKDADLAALVEQEAFSAHVASQIYEARVRAGLTQKQLAEKVGTQQSVIARLESANYESHSLATLKRIAAAVNQKLRVEFYSECEYFPNTPGDEMPAPKWGSQKNWKPIISVKDSILQKAS